VAAREPAVKDGRTGGHEHGRSADGVPAGRVLSRYDTLLVNRLLVERIAPAQRWDVLPPGREDVTERPPASETAAE